LFLCSTELKERTAMKTTQTAAPRSSARNFSIALPVQAPRNPLVAAALARKAGAHGRSGGGERQAAKRQLRTLMNQA
jgi:hypothetical protein